MKDPFSTVHQSLQPLFRIATERNGKYTYLEVQVLKETIDDYLENPTKENFISLKKAVSSSLSFFEKWQLPFEPIKESFDQEAKQHALPPINWSKVLSRSTASPRFQFSALNHAHQEEDLLTWLLSKTNKLTQGALSSKELTELLLKHQHEHGFSKKLIQQLSEQPNFLFDLIMKSANNFSKIASTSLSLYLTDEQLAAAIIKYIPDDEELSYEEVSELVEHLNNNTLSHGRSVSTLLRNTHAKDILDQSNLFRLYQNAEHANRTELESESSSYQGRANI
ncbi:hypothetical protein [Legionella sp. km772]|uniref:hypothetical protein n=1 Tax=Legionella sp. km772 TaxID=2498111 RepID=UPI000F8EF505|nr:hypothetical protein [Legionella sp. km772]RUR07119.1 hypothetical protein ELY15_12540 [Legionella sp. km772]